MESTRSMRADPGVDQRELLDAVDAHLVRYGGDFVPGLVSSASGSRLYTVDGRRLLDREGQGRPRGRLRHRTC